jgi:putative holliday junction resolvase
LHVQLEADAATHGEISPLAGYDLHDRSIAASYQENAINQLFLHSGDSQMTRILGVDFGTRRVGIALSDPGRTMAFPVEVYEPRGPEPDARYYRELVRENEIDRIIVGLPLHTSGRESDLASRARRFGDWLATVTDRPVVFFDERYSTVEAEQSLLAAGLSRKKRQARRDKLAAQIMLQGYLDAGSPDKEAAPAPLSD